MKGILRQSLQVFTCFGDSPKPPSPSNATVFCWMVTKCELLQHEAMVSESWQLKCIIYARYGATSFSIWSQELQMWLWATLSGGHTMHIALLLASLWRSRTKSKCETLNVTFTSVVLMDGCKKSLWGGVGWRYLPSHAEIACCFHFTAPLSPLILLIQMLLFMLMQERLPRLTWIDNVGCGARFLANQCKGSKQYVFVLTFFPL